MKPFGRGLAALAFAALAGAAQAEITKEIVIADLNDKSSVFSDAGGVGGVAAAQLAIDEGLLIRALGGTHDDT